MVGFSDAFGTPAPATTSCQSFEVDVPILDVDQGVEIFGSCESRQCGESSTSFLSSILCTLGLYMVCGCRLLNHNSNARPREIIKPSEIKGNMYHEVNGELKAS